jgi:repressor LexA
MLTPRQNAIYAFFVRFREENGCSPTIPEIQREFSIRSPNGVAGHLKALVRKGVLRRADRGSRQLDLAEFGAVRSVPIYGSIAAGFPGFQSAASPEGAIRIDELTLGFQPKAGSFALQVRGDSMTGAAILDGDYVVIEPSHSPAAGNIVAALIDGQCTLKRLVRVKGRWYLQAENPAYPRLQPRADLLIQGIVRAMIRRLE